LHFSSAILVAIPDVEYLCRNMALKNAKTAMRGTADENVQSNSKANVAKANNPGLDGVKRSFESIESQTCDDSAATIEQDRKSAVDECHGRMDEQSNNELGNGHSITAEEKELCVASAFQSVDSHSAIFDAITVGSCVQVTFQTEEDATAGVYVEHEEDNEDCSNDSDGSDDRHMIYSHHDDVDDGLETVRCMPLPIKPKAQVGPYIPSVISPDEYPYFAAKLNSIGNPVIAMHSSAAGNPEIKRAFRSKAFSRLVPK
jgi:hypothetical protein